MNNMLYIWHIQCMQALPWAWWHCAENSNLDWPFPQVITDDTRLATCHESWSVCLHQGFVMSECIVAS